jgi:hypothetical protein
MTELIKVEDGMTVLDMEAQRQIVAFELQMKAIKAKEEELRRRITEEMEAKGIIKLESEDLSITYKAAHDRERFAAKRLRQDHPDIYDEYVTIATVKPSILIKVK